MTPLQVQALFSSIRDQSRMPSIVRGIPWAIGR
jgi:hypothetical protein